jgi:hypothetical protein
VTAETKSPTPLVIIKKIQYVVELSMEEVILRALVTERQSCPCAKLNKHYSSDFQAVCRGTPGSLREGRKEARKF